MNVHTLTGPADRQTLVAEIRAAQAEIDALAAQRDEREAKVRRLILRLARLPGDEPAIPAAAPARTWVPLKAAARTSGRSADTIRRHGEPAGWCWRQGGRWVVDPAGLAAFLAPRRVG